MVASQHPEAQSSASGGDDNRPTGPGLGIIVSFDFLHDRELWRWSPKDTSPFITRTDPVEFTTNWELVTQLNRPEVVARPARSLAALGTPAITYLCTACSFVGGHDGERALRNAMRHPGVQTTLTAAGSVIDALSAVGAKRISVAHPYEPPVGAALVRFLGTAGFDVLTEHSLGLQTIREVYDIGYREVRELIANADHAEADALFVSCTALPTYDLIAPLERELGKPIITVNQATMWAGLRSIGHRLQGPGQRLAAITDSQIPWRR